MGIFLQNKVVQSENQSMRLQYEASEKRRGYKKERLQTVQNQILMDRPRKEFVEKNIDTIDFFADSDEEENDASGRKQRRWKRNMKKDDNFLKAESQV